MALLVGVSAAAGGSALAKEGKGRMYYRVGMRYAPSDLKLPPYDAGFVVVPLLVGWAIQAVADGLPAAEVGWRASILALFGRGAQLSDAGELGSQVVGQAARLRAGILNEGDLRDIIRASIDSTNSFNTDPARQEDGLRLRFPFDVAFDTSATDPRDWTVRYSRRNRWPKPRFSGSPAAGLQPIRGY